MEKQIGNSLVHIGDIAVGKGAPLVFIAGPCAIESEAQATSLAKEVKDAGASLFRGGAFKPRTSPYSYQGMGYPALDILKKVNMPTISEITAIEQIPSFLNTVDVIQVGSRNMMNYELLKALGKTNKPVLLKRGFAATVEEWLLAAEYLIANGNKNVILCERGIRTFNHDTRFTLDLSSVVYVKKISNLPVIVDPSHASGKASMVKDLALAAIAAGADGLMIEVSDNPSQALSDKEQAITPEELKEIIDQSQKIKEIISNGHYLKK